MSKKIVAYLDLLGFSNFTRQDKQSAIKMLDDYLGVLYRRLTEDNMHPPNSYPPETKDLAKKTSIDTFNYTLPFSDSIFLISKDEEPSMFLTQLSNFICEAFLIGYRGWRGGSDAITEKITKISEENGQIRKQDQIEYRFPVLFRGGVVYGDVEIPPNAPSIIDNKLCLTHIVIGEGVVAAVSLEKEKTRCPDILLDPCLINKIQNQSFIQIYIEAHERYSRLLWPAFNYDLDKNSNKFSEMFHPAVNLWKYFSHLECSDIYFNFLKLIIKSTMSIFDGTSESCIRNYIDKQIDDLGMSSKRDALWGE